MGDSEFLWLKEKLENIRVGDNETLSKDCEEEVYEIGGWTALKLIALLAYSYTYTTIITKYFRNIYYIDVFSGPGIVKIKNSEHKVLGSSLLIPMIYKEKFNKIILSDITKKKVVCLKKNLDMKLKEKKLDDKYEINAYDANVAIQKISREIKETRDSHYLAFLDPEGMELEWDSLSDLLSIKGDVIINFTSMIGRAYKNDEKMTTFFGSDEWRKCNTYEDYLELYMRRIEQKFQRKTLAISINKTENMKKYSLIFTIKKSTESPWFDNIVGHLKNKIENNYDDSVRKALDILAGNIKTLDDFCDFLPTGKGHDKVKTLDEFT